MRIGKDAMDERDGVCAVQLRNAFQTLRQGQLWATRCIWGEKAARQTVDGFRDAGLHLVDLGGGKNPCADGIATRGDRHGVSPSYLCDLHSPIASRWGSLKLATAATG